MSQRHYTAQATPHQVAIDELSEVIRKTGQEGKKLRIVGENTKVHFVRPATQVTPIYAHSLSGIIDYQPSEMVIRAGAGTPLSEINHALHQEGQYLPCDMPHWNRGGTLGGAVASGLSGPRRATYGAVRDFVLGVSIIDGMGRHLRFGGQVMKNVAGYDVSRMLCGGYGQLALLTEISLRTLPIPKSDTTVQIDVGFNVRGDLVRNLQVWISKALPISATVILAESTLIRLSGNRSSVEEGLRVIGVEASQWARVTTLPQEVADSHWQNYHHHTTASWAVSSNEVLWRVAVPAFTPLTIHAGGKDINPEVVEWHGQLRWYRVSLEDSILATFLAQILQASGSAQAFYGAHQIADNADGEKYDGLSTTLPIRALISPLEESLTRQIKAVFDPKAVFA